MAGNAILSHDIPPRKTSSHPKNPLKRCREIDSLTVPSHPLKIKPRGNAYTATDDTKLAAGSFTALPDEVLIQLLEFLDATSLKRLGFACKTLYAFSRHEELWKTLCIERWHLIARASIVNFAVGVSIAFDVGRLVQGVDVFFLPENVHIITCQLLLRASARALTSADESSASIWAWVGTWRSTYLNLPEPYRSRICCQVYSDVLYRPFLCAHTSLVSYATHIPACNAIPRLGDMSNIKFRNEWIDRPFILSDPVREWPIYQEWSSEAMLEKYGDVIFRAEAVNWPLKTYVEYMNDNQDESPLYLFDRSFVEKMDIRVGRDGQYWAPDCFGHDLFSVLGEERPDSRWLIVGPEKSGSTFHKDPNATSAWNAVLRGSKYWIMFPSSPSQPPPPGVFVSEDQSEVTSPLSIAEWLLGFHAQARATPGCVEAICGEGEVLHVPSGWFHLVVNLSPSIAITQNFVPEAHLANVLDFLKNKSEQVSGFRDDVKNAYDLFVDKMRELYPEVLNKALGEMSKIREGKKRKWDQLVNGYDERPPNGTSFSFDFRDEDDEDVP